MSAVEGHVSYFHEEQSFSSWLAWAIFAIVGVPVAFTLVESLFRPGLVGPSVLAIAIFLPIAAIFFLARLVVDVNGDEIRVAFHFLWPARRIALANVKRASATTYNSLVDYGGWGVRRSWKGWAFNTGGHEGVLVETNDGARLLIGSRRPKDLEAAIAKAIAERTG